MIELELNAKILPIHRESIEDFISEHIEENNLGIIDGGGSMVDTNGEILFCDIGIECDKNNEHIIIEFLNKLAFPKGSKIKLDDKVIPIGNLDGLGFYFSNELDEKVSKKYDINEVVQKFDELLGEEVRIFSYMQNKNLTALYYYGYSFEQMKEAISEFASSHPLCQKSKILPIT